MGDYNRINKVMELLGLTEHEVIKNACKHQFLTSGWFISPTDVKTKMDASCTVPKFVISYCNSVIDNYYQPQFDL